MEEENIRYILDEMYDFEADFDEEEKEDGHYFIGLFLCMDVNTKFNSKHLQLGMAISPNLFFQYEYKYVQRYLYSGIQYCRYARNYHLKISIMQLNITDDGYYLVSIKTHWLKMIQRHWKKVMRERKHILENMKKPNYLQYRELGKHIRYNIPKLKGMLSQYSNKKD